MTLKVIFDKMQEVKKLTLKKLAEHFEMVDADKHWFYNVETGEFDYYSDDGDSDGDTERFEDKKYIRLPSQFDLNEYEIMQDFAYTVMIPEKQGMLLFALGGKGAFRRFKDAVNGLNLREDWWAFRLAAFKEIAKNWCERNGIEYTEDGK